MCYRFSRVRLCATPWTVAHHAPLSMGFSRQEYQSRVPFPSPGDLPNPGIEPAVLTSSTLAGGFFTTKGDFKAPTTGLLFSVFNVGIRNAICTASYFVHFFPDDGEQCSNDYLDHSDIFFFKESPKTKLSKYLSTSL